MFYLVRLLIPVLIFSLSCSSDRNKTPSWINEYIETIDYWQLKGETPDVNYSVLSENVLKVSVAFHLKDSVHQDDWQVNITPAFLPDFHWASHLTPTDEHIIGQHAFRAPAITVASGEKKTDTDSRPRVTG